MAKRRLSSLAKEIYKAAPFESPEQEAFLSVVRTASVLEGDFERPFKPVGLSGPTYNVLRILRAAGAEGRACHEVSSHMVARVPDVTRLLDRLEKMGLAERSRCSADRRVVTARITAAGLVLLAKLDAPVTAMHKAQLGHMAAKELKMLCELLAKARRAD